MARLGPREVGQGTALNEFLTSARLIDVVIAFTVLEGLALAVYHRLSGRGLAARDYAVNLLAGLCLMLAVRGAVGGAQWQWVGLCLLAAGLVHAADLWRRWHHQPQATPSNPVPKP
jgi:hypothetical protein